MISRKSSKAIADSYHSNFIFISGAGHYQGRPTISNNELYDFLFVNNFDPWLLNAINGIPTYSPRTLQEFIMKIHTGESVANATPKWSWQQRQAFGQRILKDLAECLLRDRNTNPSAYREHSKESIDLMQRTLELDGYIYRDNMLWIPEETIIGEPEEQGILQGLTTSLKLPDIPIIAHHLELSINDYQESRWDDSISNSRKVLEAVLSQVAARYAIISHSNGLSSKALERPAEVREYLENAKILEKKEKETISQVYGLLSETGGHPYIADRDQARLMRHLALTFSQFVLLRLEGVLRERGE